MLTKKNPPVTFFNLLTPILSPTIPLLSRQRTICKDNTWNNEKITINEIFSICPEIHSKLLCSCICVEKNVESKKMSSWVKNYIWPKKIESLSCTGPLLVQNIIHFLSLHLYSFLSRFLFSPACVGRCQWREREEWVKKDVRIIDLLSFCQFFSLLSSSFLTLFTMIFNSIRLSNNICRICLFELVLLSTKEHPPRGHLEKRLRVDKFSDKFGQFFAYLRFEVFFSLSHSLIFIEFAMRLFMVNRWILSEGEKEGMRCFEWKFYNK